MPVGTATSSAASYANYGGNSVAALQKQLAALEQKVRDESNSNDDAKTKEVKVAALQLQIQVVSSQIQQIQLKASQAKPNATPALDAADPSKTKRHAKHKPAAVTNGDDDADAAPTDPTSTSVELDTVG